MDVDLNDLETLKPFAKDFTYDGTDYVLREASGGAIVEYDNADDATRTYNPETGKLIGIKDRAKLVPLLVSHCIFKKSDNSNVPLATIEKWPDRVLKRLYKAIRQVSDLEGSPDEITLLIKAMKAEGQGRLKSLIQFVKDLDDKEYGPLKAAFKPTAEELAKNGQGGSTAGSS